MPVNIIDTLKPKNGLNFPVVEAIDVFVEDYENLADAISHFATDVMIEAINTVLSGKSNTSDVNTYVSNLQAQIDQIVISASAESIVAPEVASARVDANGNSFATLKERIDSDFSKQKAYSETIDKSLSAFEDSTVKRSFISMRLKNVKDVNKYEGYYDSGSGLEANETYTTWQFASKVDFDLYFNKPNAYLSLTIYSDPEMSSVVKQRIRHLPTDDWTVFPDEDNPLHVAKGQWLSVSVYKSDESAQSNYAELYTNDFLYGFSLNDSVYFSSRMIEDIDAITDSIDDLDGKIFSQSSERTAVSDLEGAIEEKGFYGAIASTDEVRILASDSYDSYYIISDRECDIYPITNGFYLSIVHGKNYSGTVIHSETSIGFLVNNPARYRTIDSNLPTQDNPLHVDVGDILIFSTAAGKMFEIYGYTRKSVISDEFIEEVKEGLPSEKRCKVEYKSTSGIDSSTERIEIYIPAAVGYTRYRFVHSVSANINADVWRVSDAYAVNDDLTERYALTTTGEWECAIHLANREDFSGGIAHGDEKLNSVSFFIDGAKIDVDNISGIIEFAELKIIENTTLYDPADSETAIATHGSEHTFDSSGLTVKQRIVWQYSGALTNCYLAMFPIAKSVSYEFYTDTNYELIPIEDTSHSMTDTYDVTICKEETGTSGKFMITEYPTLGYFYMTDNGGTSYNKCYYVINSGGSVEAGTKWKSETKYNFEIGK